MQSPTLLREVERTMRKIWYKIEEHCNCDAWRFVIMMIVAFIGLLVYHTAASGVG